MVVSNVLKTYRTNKENQHIEISDYTLNQCSSSAIDEMIVVDFTVVKEDDILSIDRFSGETFIKNHNRGLAEVYIDGSRKIEFGHQQVVVETTPAQVLY